MDRYIDYCVDIGKDLQKAYNDGYEQGKADAVKHGRWIDSDGYPVNWSEHMQYHLERAAYCSECEERIEENEVFFVMARYCPSCGSRMDLEG